MRKKKILILGVKEFASIPCYYWWHKDLPNISDYDVVIINVVSLTENLHILNSETLNNIKSSLLKLLDSEGTLYAIACPFKRETKRKRMPKFASQGNRTDEEIASEIIDNYMWSPIELEIINEEGDTVEIQDASFEEHFKNLKKWSFILKSRIKNSPKEAFIDSYEILFHKEEKGEKGNTFMISIATDRRKRAIAAKFYYQLAVLAVRAPFDFPYAEEIKMKSGNFILLPQPTEINDIEAINYILEKFLGVFQKTPPPDWAKKFPVPGLNKIESKLAEVETEISKLEKENSELKQQESELASYRELLYETGIPLEEIVRKVFTELGYPPKPPKFGEEYIIEFNNTLGIIECKGVKKSISRRDFRQLLDYVKNYETEPDLSKLKIKGILIANAWRNLKPHERDKHDKPVFPAGESGVIEISKKHNMALVSTVDLFNIFCKYKERKIEPIKIVEAIFKADGIVKFPT